MSMENQRKPLVSIVTPTYNSEAYIGNAILSILNQTYKNWELLISDDCSSDSTVNIVKKYCKQYPNIRLFKLSENSGPGIARNKALENASGKYIAFLDSDDEWVPIKLEEQVAFMEKYIAAISFTGYSLMDNNLQIIKSQIKVPFSVNFSQYLKTTIIGMSTSMINREMVGDFRLNKIRSRQDGVLWIELLKRGHIAYGLNKQLVKYRIRKNSVSANKLKAIFRIWYIYRKYAGLNIVRTSYYFTFYIFNNIMRRFVNN